MKQQEACPSGIAAIPCAPHIGRAPLIWIAGIALWWVACGFAAGTYFKHRTDNAYREEIGKIGKQYGKPGFTSYAPIFDGERVLGAAFSRIKLSNFQSWLSEANAFMIDGVVITFTDITGIKQPEAELPALGVQESRL